MKTISWRIKKLQPSNFLASGYAIIEVIGNDDGKEFHIGDYMMTSSNKYKIIATIEAEKDIWLSRGYEAVGDWNSI